MLDRLLRALSSADVTSRACNQYSRTYGDLRGNTIRRRNLRLYLELLLAIRPNMLLIGEAPSYRGGRLTGIAFVSETVMLGGVETRNGRMLGAAHGFRKATTGPQLSTEASATMVWGTIKDIDPLPLLWNAFPFHPFHEGNPSSNRVPSAGELAIGQEFVTMLLELFPIRQVVAVGNQASVSLSQIGIEHVKVRHPSMGGKNQFVAGIRALEQNAIR